MVATVTASCKSGCRQESRVRSLEDRVCFRGYGTKQTLDSHLPDCVVPNTKLEGGVCVSGMVAWHELEEASIHEIVLAGLEQPVLTPGLSPAGFPAIHGIGSVVQGGVGGQHRPS